MNVEELINELQQIKDKTLSVRIQPHFDWEEENLWVDEVVVFDKGTTGYERFGEVVLVGYE